MKSKSYRYFLPSLGYANVKLRRLVSTRESRVMVTQVTGQLTDGSRGSLVIKCDPLSALLVRGIAVEPSPLRDGFLPREWEALL